MFSVPGGITMGNASRCLADACKAIDAGETEIGFGAAAHSDSSAVAVVLAALRHGRLAGRAVHVTGVPPSMLSLARLYGVEDLIGAVAAG